MVVRQVASLSSVGVATHVIAIPGGVRSYLQVALRVLRMNFEPRRYDLVHAHTGHCGIVACLQVRHPVVLTYVGYDLDTPAEDREGPRTKLERLVFRHLSLFVAGTIAKSARGRKRLPRRSLARNTLLPNGVDRDSFRPMERDEARRRLGWALDGPPTVLFAADPKRFTKRYELARRAVEEARKRLPKVVLAVCDDVMPDEVPLWMNAADVLLLTSVGEGSPNVVKEAMACNLPVVSVDVGDVREVVDRTRHCRVCPDDPVGLADALTDVLDALPERSNGREHTAHLDLLTIAERLREVYERASTRGPGPLGFMATTLPRRRRKDGVSTQPTL